MLAPDQATPEFAGLHDVFRYTLRAFHNYWERSGELASEDINFLATVTLSHIDDMEAAFRWVLRSDELSRGELYHLLRCEHIPDWSNEPDSPPTRPVPPDLRKVMALRHAQVVFGYIPMTPKGHVSYPGYSSYSDIKVPRTPLELRERIRELARGVWDTATRRAPDALNPECSRRVYGFFEAGSWLTTTHMRRIRRH
ncbi:MAG: hypothetical protein M3281_00605 [Chloroflexota bacterium]|nr:hypothetical protein [Chloroflexota bacterium]